MSGRWAKDKVTAWVTAPNGPPLSSAERMVVVVLAEHVDRHFTCFPRLAVLAAESGLSERTVKRALASLEAAELVFRARRRTGRRVTRYFVNHPASPYRVGDEDGLPTEVLEDWHRAVANAAGAAELRRVREAMDVEKAAAEAIEKAARKVEKKAERATRKAEKKARKAAEFERSVRVAVAEMLAPHPVDNPMPVPVDNPVRERVSGRKPESQRVTVSPTNGSSCHLPTGHRVPLEAGSPYLSFNRSGNQPSEPPSITSGEYVTCESGAPVDNCDAGWSR